MVILGYECQMYHILDLSSLNVETTYQGVAFWLVDYQRSEARMYVPDLENCKIFDNSPIYKKKINEPTKFILNFTENKTT